MSSLYEFSSFYEFIGLPIIEGVIVGLDPSNDTAKVKIQNSDGRSFEEFSNVPIFFHCRRDASHRGNGAIEGASSAFSIGDKVLILCKIDPPSSFQSISCVAVIGHAGPRRDCGVVFTVCGGQVTGDLSYGIGGPFIAPYKYAIFPQNSPGNQLILLFDPKSAYEAAQKYREDYTSMPNHFYFFPQLKKWYYNLYEFFDSNGQPTGQFFHTSPYKASIKIPIMTCASSASHTIPFYTSYEPSYWEVRSTTIDGISYKTVSMSRFSLVERIQISSHAPQMGGSYLSASREVSESNSSQVEKESPTLEYYVYPRIISVHNELTSTVQPYGILSAQMLVGTFDVRWILACGFIHFQSEKLTDKWVWDKSSSKFNKSYSSSDYVVTTVPLDSVHKDPIPTHNLQKGVLHVCPSDTGLYLIRAETFYSDVYDIQNYRVVEEDLPDSQFLVPSSRRLRYGRYKLTKISPSGTVKTFDLDDPRYYGEGLQARFAPRCFGYHPDESNNLIISSSLNETALTCTATFTNKSWLRYVGEMWFSRVQGMSFSELTQKVCDYYTSKGISPCPISWIQLDDNLTINNTFRSFIDYTGVRPLLIHMIPKIQKDYFSAADSNLVSWTESSFTDNYTKFNHKIYINNTLVVDGGLGNLIYETRDNSWTTTGGDPPATCQHRIICGGSGFSGYGYGNVPPMSNKYDMVMILPYRFFVARSQTFSYGGWVFFAKKTYQSHSIEPVNNLIVPGNSYSYTVGAESKVVIPSFHWVPAVFCKVRTKVTFHVAYLINQKSYVYNIPDTICSLEFDEFFACADVSGTKYSYYYYPNENIRSVARPVTQPYHYVNLVSCAGFPCMFTACIVDKRDLIFKYDVFKYNPWTHNVVHIDLPSPDLRRSQQYRLQGTPPLPTDAMPTDSRYLGAILLDPGTNNLSIRFHEKVYGKDAYPVYFMDQKTPVSDSNNVLRSPRVNNILDI